MVTVYLGLGGNLGDRLANLRAAIERLAEQVTVEVVSPVYETEPVGYREQPWFLNAVVRGETGLSPRDLLAFVKQIEGGLGRRPSFRNGPRPVDVDILLYGDEIVETPELTIPHPRLAEREFVLRPLADLAPDVQHPKFGRSVRDLLAALPRGPEVRGPLPRARARAPASPTGGGGTDSNVGPGSPFAAREGGEGARFEGGQVR